MKSIDDGVAEVVYTLASIGVGILGSVLVVLIMNAFMPAFRGLHELYIFLSIISYIAVVLIYATGFGFAAHIFWVSFLSDWLRKRNYIA